MTTAYDFTATTIDGEKVDLADYRGKPLLIVNTASQCGFTPQYEGLEALNRKFGDKGLTILGFPCDQFGHQEPGNADEIKEFCSLRYDVTFPMHEKINVNGPEAHPLYAWLRSQKSGLLGGRINWNFTKFLVDKTGAVVGRYEPQTTPEEIAPDLDSFR